MMIRRDLKSVVLSVFSVNLVFFTIARIQQKIISLFSYIITIDFHGDALKYYLSNVYHN